MTSARPRKVANVLRGELPDGEVVVSVQGGDRAIVLNYVADAVLGLCDGSRTVAEIAEFVRDTVKVPDNTDVVADITAVLEQLQTAGIVEPA